MQELCFACLYKSLKIVNIVFPNFLPAWRLSLLAIKSSSPIDSNHGEELWAIAFCREGGAYLSSTVRKKSQNWFAFSTNEYSETLEISAINDGRSMLAMFLTVLYKVDGLETETLKQDLVI